MKRPESATDTMWRYRGVVLVVLVPVVLIGSVYALLPRGEPVHVHQDPLHNLHELHNHASGPRYAVVLDAGSTGSRVHVFRFDLVNGALKLHSDTFEQLKPGLSAYADDPDAAAASLKPLLTTAINTVPKKLQAITPVSLKATAGLRLLPGDKADKILEAVRAFLRTYPFRMSDDAVSVMDGKDEGAFAWLTLNYLLGRLDKGPDATVAAIDLGGGSVQEAFAMSPEQAKVAPPGLVTKLRAGSHVFHVYVHSYLGFGLMAARAKALAGSKLDKGHPCYGKGALEVYSYAGTDYPIKPAEAGPQFSQCADVHVTAMEIKKACDAPQDHCTFGGVWRGPRRAEVEYYVSSYLWDRAVDTEIVKDEQATTWRVKPAEFSTKAIDVCSKADASEVVTAYPRVKPDAAPFLCADLTFCAQLLTAGFKLPVSKEVTLVKQIQYNGQHIEAAWPLGAAVNDLSSAA